MKFMVERSSNFLKLLGDCLRLESEDVAPGGPFYAAGKVR